MEMKVQLSVNNESTISVSNESKTKRELITKYIESNKRL